MTTRQAIVSGLLPVFLNENEVSSGIVGGAFVKQTSPSGALTAAGAACSTQAAAFSLGAVAMGAGCGAAAGADVSAQVVNAGRSTPGFVVVQEFTSLLANASPLGASCSATAGLVSATAGNVSSSWQPLKIGGGGWVRSLNITPDGTMTCRADTFDAFRWSASQNNWVPMVTLANMPPNSVGLTTGKLTINPGGPYEIVAAPSVPNGQTVYMHYNSLLYKSTTGGIGPNSWSQLTGFASDYHPQSGNGNNNFASMQKTMAVDPLTPNVVLVGSPQQGLYLTIDGGTTWALIPGIPASLEHIGQTLYPGHTGIVFDTASGQTGGLTNVAYCAVAGYGVYQTTTTAAGTWSLLPGSPQFVTDAVAYNGLYYCCCWQTWAQATAAGGAWNSPQYIMGYNATALWTTLYVTTSWINLSIIGNAYWSITINPSDSTNLVVTGLNGNMMQTANSGGNWAPLGGAVLNSAADIPWLQYCSSGWSAVSSINFDPLVPHRIWASQGLGLWYTDSITSSSQSSGPSITWNCQTRGIEQLVTACVLYPPGGSPIYGFWDQGSFTIPDLETTSYPTSPHTINTQFSACWSLDFAKDNALTIVQIAQWSPTPGGDNSCYSSDGGVTWNEFASKPWGIPGTWNGGAIAAGSSLNFVYLPAQAGLVNGQLGTSELWFTLNGGNSWSPSAGLPTTGWASSYGAGMCRRLVADYVINSSTGYYNFYVIHPVNGTYMSVDGGANWTLQGPGPIVPYTLYPFTKSVPGNAGHIFHCYGIGPSPANSVLMRTTNYGVNWTAVPHISLPTAVSLGGIAPGQTYPSVWMVGYYDPSGVFPSTTYGIWRSLDNCVTWTNLTPPVAGAAAYPFGHFDTINAFDVDKVGYQTALIGFSGSGGGYGTNL